MVESAIEGGRQVLHLPPNLLGDTESKVFIMQTDQADTSPHQGILNILRMVGHVPQNTTLQVQRLNVDSTTIQGDSSQS